MPWSSPGCSRARRPKTRSARRSPCAATGTGWILPSRWTWPQSPSCWPPTPPGWRGSTPGCGWPRSPRRREASPTPWRFERESPSEPSSPEGSSWKGIITACCFAPSSAHRPSRSFPTMSMPSSSTASVAASCSTRCMGPSRTASPSMSGPPTRWRSPWDLNRDSSSLSPSGWTTTTSSRPRNRSRTPRYWNVEECGRAGASPTRPRSRSSWLAPGRRPEEPRRW